MARARSTTKDTPEATPSTSAEPSGISVPDGITLTGAAISAWDETLTRTLLDASADLRCEFSEETRQAVQDVLNQHGTSVIDYSGVGTSFVAGHGFRVVFTKPLTDKDVNDFLNDVEAALA